MDKFVKDISLASAIILTNLIIGTVCMHYLEGWRWIDSLYFAVVTISTIGYGDYYPSSDISKMFVIFYVLVGVSTTLYALTLIAKAWIERYTSLYEVIARHAIIKPYKKIRDIKLKHRYHFDKGILKK